MKHCDIKGCHGMVSGLLSSQAARARWIEVRACRCGAWDASQQKSCTCVVDENPEIPTTYWPNLDWFALGGVDKVTLCPRHRKEVFDEVVSQRAQDPSMNPTVRNRGNLH